jgi:hypothetical protein
MEKKEDFIPEKTAYILADESLLIPLMSAIPSDIDFIILMGYPLRMPLLSHFCLICWIYALLLKTGRVKIIFTVPKL